MEVRIGGFQIPQIIALNKKRPNRSESNPQVHLLEIYPPAISLFYLTNHLMYRPDRIRKFCNCPADVFNGVAMKVYNHPEKSA